MAFVVLGLMLLTFKLLDVDPVAVWPWWGILSPFGAAALWWAWADSTGFTKRREIDKIEARKQQRRARSMEHMGMDEHGRPTGKRRR